MLLLLAAACHAQPLTIAVSRTSLSLPLFVADAQRFFQAEGLAVSLRECIGGHRCRCCWASS